MASRTKTKSGRQAKGKRGKKGAGSRGKKKGGVGKKRKNKSVGGKKPKRGGKKSKKGRGVSKARGGPPKICHTVGRLGGGGGAADKRVPAPVRGRIYYGGGGWGGGGGGGGDYEGYSTTSPLQNFGGGAPPSVGDYDGMRAGGVGQVFAAIFRTALPLLKSLLSKALAGSKTPAGKLVTEEATRAGLRAGINLVGDVLKGAKPGKASAERARQSARQLGNAVLSMSKRTGAAAAKKKKADAAGNVPPRSASSRRALVGKSGSPPIKRGAPTARRSVVSDKRPRKDLFDS